MLRPQPEPDTDGEIAFGHTFVVGGLLTGTLLFIVLSLLW